LTVPAGRHIFYYTYQPLIATLVQRNRKADRLKALGVLNPHPERVRAPGFQVDTFFDPRDLVQVKYEMLRLVRVEGASKADAAATFGLSRPTLYQAETAFERDGLVGLLPRQRGPKGAHKLDAEVMAFVDAHLEGKGTMRARELARLIEAEFGLRVHPRSIERALRRKKKRQPA
jgi:transposase